MIMHVDNFPEDAPHSLVCYQQFLAAHHVQTRSFVDSGQGPGTRDQSLGVEAGSEDDFILSRNCALDQKPNVFWKAGSGTWANWFC